MSQSKIIAQKLIINVGKDGSETRASIGIPTFYVDQTNIGEILPIVELITGTNRDFLSLGIANHTYQSFVGKRFRER